MPFSLNHVPTVEDTQNPWNSNSYRFVARCSCGFEARVGPTESVAWEFLKNHIYKWTGKVIVSPSTSENVTSVPVDPPVADSDAASKEVTTKAPEEPVKTPAEPT